MRSLPMAGTGWNRHDVDFLMTFIGTTADGREVEVNGCDIFTFQNGKIAVKTSYFKNRTA